MHSELQTSTDNKVTFNMFCFVPFCSLKCHGELLNGVSVIRIVKTCPRKTCFDGLALGLLWACFV